MGLRNVATADNRKILEDTVVGGGWPIKITDPNGVVVDDMVGWSNDIAQIIDPDTGQAVSGRLASVALHVESLTEKGLKLPQGIADSKLKPWIIEFTDINLNPFKFKVQQSNPDRTLGMVTCLLELYV